MSKTAKSAKAKSKPVSKKPVAKAKVKAKTKAGAVAKSQVKKVAKSAEPVGKRGFMWKLLETREQQRQKQNQESTANPFARGADEVKPSARHHSFNKFAGPRRRAG